MSEMIVQPPELQFVAWLENLRVDLAESVGGMVIRGARPVPVGSSSGATNQATSSGGALMGYALRNLSDVTDAVVLLRSGGSDGEVIVPVTLAGGESVRDWFGPGGINVVGLFVDVDSGEVDGAVFLRGSD